MVDARKPLFFTQSAAFREVLPDGALSFTTIGAHLDKNKIYSYGNLQEFTEMIHIRAKEILYCGDHITGDTGATKNELQRTLYICPEIKKEIAVMSNIPDLYRYLSKLERTRGQILQRCCDENIAEKPQELEDVEKNIADIQQQIDSRFNANFGSIFTTTWGKTWLSQYL